MCASPDTSEIRNPERWPLPCSACSASRTLPSQNKKLLCANAWSMLTRLQILCQSTILQTTRLQPVHIIGDEFLPLECISILFEPTGLFTNQNVKSCFHPQACRKKSNKHSFSVCQPFQTNTLKKINVPRQPALSWPSTYDRSLLQTGLGHCHLKAAILTWMDPQSRNMWVVEKTIAYMCM